MKVGPKLTALGVTLIALTTVGILTILFGKVPSSQTDSPGLLTKKPITK